MLFSHKPNFFNSLFFYSQTGEIASHTISPLFLGQIGRNFGLPVERIDKGMKIITSEHTLLKLKVKTLVDMGVKLDAISRGIGVNGTNLYKWMRGERNLNNETAVKIELWLQEFAGKVGELAGNKAENLDDRG